MIPVAGSVEHVGYWFTVFASGLLVSYLLDDLKWVKLTLLKISESIGPTPAFILASFIYATLSLAPILAIGKIFENIEPPPSVALEISIYGILVVLPLNFNLWRRLKGSEIFRNFSVAPERANPAVAGLLAGFLLLMYGINHVDRPVPFDVRGYPISGLPATSGDERAVEAERFAVAYIRSSTDIHKRMGANFSVTLARSARAAREAHLVYQYELKGASEALRAIAVIAPAANVFTPDAAKWKMQELVLEDESGEVMPIIQSSPYESRANTRNLPASQPRPSDAPR